MRLTKTSIDQLIVNATILGTGGGGRLDNARRLLGRIELGSVPVVSLDELPTAGYVVTAYGVGGLTKPAVDRPEVRQRCQELLQQRLGQPIIGVIPVEMGPGSVAQAIALAAALDVPLVDGDLAGLRAVPDIFIELITLYNQERCPMVLANNDGDMLVLEALSTPEKIETIARAFAMASSSNALAVGYPLTAAQLKQSAAQGSIAYCLDINRRLTNDFKLVTTGTVTLDDKQDIGGFTVGTLQIADSSDVYTVAFKNEYLVLTKNGRTVVTCPDIICLVDQQTGLGLNNGDDNTGKQVAVYVRPAVAGWQTAAGRKLFSPRALGLPYNQKVLKG